MAYPHGLSIFYFATHVEYPTRIMQWREDFYIHPINGVHHNIGFYDDMLSHLILDHVIFCPYYLYPVWDELESELVGSR